MQGLWGFLFVIKIIIRIYLFAKFQLDAILQHIDRAYSFNYACLKLRTIVCTHHIINWYHFNTNPASRTSPGSKLNSTTRCLKNGIRPYSNHYLLCLYNTSRFTNSPQTFKCRNIRSYLQFKSANNTSLLQVDFSSPIKNWITKSISILQKRHVGPF